MNGRLPLVEAWARRGARFAEPAYAGSPVRNCVMA